MDAASLLAAIVEGSSDAIVGKSLDGTVLSWNHAAERIFGYGADEMVGQSIRILIPDDRQAEEDAILAAITQGERVPTFETIRRRKDGSAIHLAVTVSPVRDAQGRVVAASKIARDISAARAVEQALQESETRFRLMADNISQLAWIAAPDGTLTWYNRRWYEYTGTTFADVAGWGWRSVHHPAHVDRVEEKFRSCVGAAVEWEDTFPLRGADGRYRWFLSRALPLKRDDGSVICWFGTNTDITEQLEAERRIELLLLEVNHRSKNMLALIQSLARRTAATATDPMEFVGRLERRIAGLAANQDILVKQAWNDVPIAELVEAQLSFLGEARGQIHAGGLPLDLQPAAAETIGMALHELATNALKYGALSRSGGRVDLIWALNGEDKVRLEWRESGGPAVAEPQRHGFGTRLIADVPRGKLGGRVRLDYAPDGFVWTLDCPVERILALKDA